MAITNGYCTVDELRARMGYPASDTAKDTMMEDIIEAASRWIDRWCSRRFYADTANSTRYYTATSHRTLLLNDDVVSIGTLATDSDGDRVYEYTWASTDYDLLPLNASADGKPYTMIQTTPQGNYEFPLYQKSVSIYGKFGLSCPHDVREACLLMSARLFKRKDAPFGIAGVSELGTIQVIDRIDRDVQALLAPWRKLV